MTDQLTLTQKWLRPNIQSYSHKDIVYNHVNVVLSTYPTFRPKTDVYTYDDGRSQLLLCVHGLLPIAYRGASYNIPVTIWLTLEYPTQPPLVYVVPTSDMLVKPGRFLDVSGRCEPAYIRAWQKKSEGCNIKALMEILTDQFSREPPVYAKPQSTSTPPREGSPSVSVTPDYSSRPPPPPPHPNESTSSPSPAQRPTPPLRPSISDVSTYTASPTVATLFSRSPKQSIYHPSQSATSLTTQQGPPIYSTSPTLRHSSPQSHISSPSFIRLSPPHPRPEPVPHEHWSSSSRLTEPPPQSRVSHQPMPPQTVASRLPLPLPTHPLVPLALSTSAPNYLDEDVEDGAHLPAPPASKAPPRPPNPEILQLHAQIHAKFNSEFAALDRALAMDVQRLRTAQSDLLVGEPAIRDEMGRLEAVRDVCRVVAGRLRSTVQSAEMNLSELRRKGDPEVDELICSTTIVYNQLIDLVAEDNAIEDTIYHLHRALNTGRIDLDKFLRTTRALAEEQFMKRALAEKIVSLIPMGAWS